ncbi:MAG: hypothetical protein WCK00_16440 [Deltaproteobacteria bacterium]
MELSFTLLLHMIGLGMLFTAVIGGWILNMQYQKADDWKTRAIILKSLRPIGLLSPIAVLVMLISGIGNMHATHVGIFTERWLTLKILFFTASAGLGIYAGILGAKRGKLVARIAGGTAAEGSEKNAGELASQQKMLGFTQFALLFVILVLSLFKP